MAEGPAEKNEVVKSLEEEIKCPLCFETFTEPKRLPCEHVFCAQCLQMLTLRAIDRALICPVCRKHTPLQGFEVNQFPTAYQVNRFIEIYRNSLVKMTVTAVPEKIQPDCCSLHVSQSLALYCETCKKLVCRDCVIISCSKRNHNFGFLKDVAQKNGADLEKKLQPIRALHQDMCTTLLGITIANQQLERQKEENMKMVEITFDALFNVLQQEKRYITTAIEDQFEEQVANNASKRKGLSEVVTKLATLIESVDEMSMDKPFPVIHEEMTKRKSDIEYFKRQFTVPSLHPVKASKLEMELLNPVDLEVFCKEKCFAYRISPADAIKYHFDRSTQFHSMHLQEPFRVKLYMKSCSGYFKIKSKLVCCYDSPVQTVDVSQISPTTFWLSVVPLKRGRHELHIQHNNTHICGSPIPCYVLFDPRQIKKLGKPLRKTLSKAGAVKCHEDKIYVVEMEEGIAVLEHSNKNMNVVKTTAFAGINEIMFHNNFIYYTDSIKRKDRLLKADVNGHLLALTGGRGARPGLFKWPNGIRLSKKNEIYVCDSGNHRIQVLDTELNLQRTIGEKGSAPGQFICPADLDFDEDANIYVVEVLNHRVQVLTPQGQHIRFIGTYGTGPGELNKPASPAIHKGNIFITDSENKRISVFTTGGEFVTTFGEGEVTKPECIAVDKDGFIFVTNNRSEIVRF